MAVCCFITFGADHHLGHKTKGGIPLNDEYESYLAGNLVTPGFTVNLGWSRVDSHSSNIIADIQKHCSSKLNKELWEAGGLQIEGCHSFNITH